MPGTSEEIVAAFGERDPPPEDGARELAARRVDFTGEVLIDRADIEGDRVRTSPDAAALGADGEAGSNSTSVP